LNLLECIIRMNMHFHFTLDLKLVFIGKNNERDFRGKS
jgi:hypothetical protein